MHLKNNASLLVSVFIFMNIYYIWEIQEQESKEEEWEAERESETLIKVSV